MIFKFVFVLNFYKQYKSENMSLNKVNKWDLLEVTTINNLVFFFTLCTYKHIFTKMDYVILIICAFVLFWLKSYFGYVLLKAHIRLLCFSLGNLIKYCIILSYFIKLVHSLLTFKFLSYLLLQIIIMLFVNMLIWVYLPKFLQVEKLGQVL